jgi:hypothetical protein
MNLRNAVEEVLRSWNRYEVDRHAAAIIDYDCHPSASDVRPAASRLHVFRGLTELQGEAIEAADRGLITTLAAHLAYLRALLGERPALDTYVHATQGCPAAGWPDEYVAAVGQLARDRLGALGISWGPDTETSLRAAEGPLDVEAVPDAIRQAAADLEPAVRRLTGAGAQYRLTIETAHVDEYWSYWLDGAGQDARLRINLRNAGRFTRVSVRQFALHEVLGHALQYAALADRCSRENVPWVRLLSVHAPHQVLFEGLAQALPLFITPMDEALVARVRLAHYLELVRGVLYVSVNSGASVEECADYARSHVPFWTDDQIGDTLTDSSVSPRLRTYLWSYPAGLDWFVSLADVNPPATCEVLHAAYLDPLTPGDLMALWPAGPPIGGPGRAVRVRNATVR